MKRAIVVGSGAGGAAAAKELQGRFQVMLLEEGGEFRPFSLNLGGVEKFKKMGLLFDVREIGLIFPHIKVLKTAEGMALIRGKGLGGTTAISTGNALRKDQDLKRMGIDLDAEFEELMREIPVTEAHQKNWRPATRRLFDVCEEMGFHPKPMPKMGEYERCANCGRCVLGCPHGVKWDSRIFLKTAVANGASVVTGCRVEKVVIEGGRAVGVVARTRGRRKIYEADVIVLAAGGLGTPVILRNSGIACEARLFVDPVLCVAAVWEDARQNDEVPMPFIIQKDHAIISPYFDLLSYFFNRMWRSPARNILSLMIKLADSCQGEVIDGKIRKKLTPEDREFLGQAAETCADIFGKLGVGVDRLFVGTVNAGHPGGMLPLKAQDADTLHSGGLPGNLYVADATLFPESLGNPPILTILALAKKVAKRIISQFIPHDS